MLADGGEITVVRRAANYVYGSWRVTVPEGAEQVVTAEDRTDGYLYHPVGAPAGRFDLAFVRQDATITLHEVTEQGVTSGDSDVELQMEAGQKRSEGRALIDRSISTAGLGRLRPGVDFVVGDVWPVKVWGRVVELVIAGFDWVVEDSGRVGVSVRAGGQLVSDPELLRSLNSEALMQLDAEARRAAREEKRLAEQAATDRQQTSQIRATQTALSNQQQQIRSWGAQVTSNNNKTRSLLIPQASGWTGVSRLARIILDRVPNLTQSDINYLNAIDSDTYTLGGTFANMYFAELNNP